MNWYIGQRVVAITDHSQGAFNKGDEFILDGVSDGICNCSGRLLDIGVKVNRLFEGCIVCGIRRIAHDDTWWFSENRFAPIQSRPELSELTDEMILTEVEELQTA